MGTSQLESTAISWTVLASNLSLLKINKQYPGPFGSPMKNPIPLLLASLILPLIPIQAAESEAPPAQPAVRATPTKEQTIAFIRARVEGGVFYNQATRDILVVTRVVSITLADCKLVLKLTRDFGKNLSHLEVTVPLVEVQQVSRETDEMGTTFSLFSESKSIERVIAESNKEPKLVTSNLVWFPVKSHKDAEQLEKAFNHLRKLCGAPDPLAFD